MHLKLRNLANQLINFQFYEFICTLLIVITLILVMIQIIARYIFGVGILLGATEELPRVFLMWYTFIVMAIGLIKGGHPRLSLIKEKIPPKFVVILEAFVDICIAYFLIFMVRYGFEYYFRTAGDHTTSLRFDRNLFYLPIPVGGLLGIVFLVIKWKNFYKDRLSQCNRNRK